MNIHRDFDYLKDENLAGVDSAVIIRNVYKRLQELNETPSRENIEKVLKVLKFDTTKVPSVLVRLQRLDGTNQEESEVDLSTFKRLLKTSSSGGITGYSTAAALVTGKNVTGGLERMLNGINKNNMFSQHDGDYVRYDVQDPGKSMSNYQIQVGGKKYRTTGKTSVTAVLVEDQIIKLCDKVAAINNHMGTVMKEQHKKSWNGGQKIKIELKQ